MLHFFKKNTQLSPQEIFDVVQKQGIGFIDVRTVSEYCSGHAKYAKNIPLETLSDSIDTLCMFDEVYIICQSGGRSAQAVAYLQSKSIRAHNVSGGTSVWKLLGLAME